MRSKAGGVTLVPEGFAFWATSPADLLHTLRTSARGLTSNEASTRLENLGPNALRLTSRFRSFELLVAQFRSPIILFLLFAAGLAFYLGQHSDALIILGIVAVSGLLGFWQERGAAGAVEALLARVRIQADVLRDGIPRAVAVEVVVPGDVVLLSAGDTIPGDSMILDSKDLYVDEAALTGETYPVEKSPAVVPPEAELSRRSNCLFFGTHVVSGTASAVVVHTGPFTEFSAVSKHLSRSRPETEFERGVRWFGYLLLEVTLVLVFAIFAINVSLRRPVLDSFLFSLAIAVGLTPQLLPAIISIGLSRGARRMAERKVIVKRLASIENFGSMDVLCSDKTGTLTEGVVRVHAAIDLEGQPSDKVRLFAFLNASYQAGYANPIDQAIARDAALDPGDYRKLDEVPYDFLRKRLGVLVEHRGVEILISKGAVDNILEICANAETDGGRTIRLAEVRARIESRYRELGAKGFRTLGVAYRELPPGTVLDRSHESEMTLIGFIVLHDPLNERIAVTIQELKRLGVTLKLITGDNRHVAESVAMQVGIEPPDAMTGCDLRATSNEALSQRVRTASVFAEVEPNQKERVLLALRRAGYVVGYLGDGINDASALHAADVGISVDSAVDVAKEAADIVLLAKGLDVLAEGIREGRITFANTLKYVNIATSANFGNMLSMASLSLFLPYLPLLPKQILLLNLLTDLPEMAIGGDRVDPEFVERPRRWQIGEIRRFMIVFGVLSSLFDFATFGVLLGILHVSAAEFRTGWFVESIVSAILVVLVIRTRRPLHASPPGRWLTFNTLMVGLAAIILATTPVGSALGFTPISVRLLIPLSAITVAYVAAAEMMKRLFYRTRKSVYRTLDSGHSLP
jgi:Mg2+-importing ATPase